MGSSARREPVRFPDAKPGTCRFCGRRCQAKRRFHDDCKATHFARNNYRKAAEAREGKWQRCVDCHKVEGEHRWVWGEWRWETVVIQRDHPKRITDGGPKEWTVALCERCHRRKTGNENRKGRAVTSRKAPRAPRTSSPFRGWGWNIAGLVMLAAGVWWFAKDPAVPSPDAPESPRVPDLVPLLAFVVGVFVTVAAFLYVRWLARRRARRNRDLGDRLAKETGSNPADVRLRGVRWYRGIPVSGSCTYSRLFNDLEGSADRAGVEAVLRGKIGRPTTIEWDPPHDRFRWHPQTEEEATRAPAEPSLIWPEVRQRVEDSIRGAIKGDVMIEWHRADDVGPLAFTVSYPSTYNDDSPEVRQSLVEKVNAKAPGRWKPHWETEANMVRFERRPPMKSRIDNPVISAATSDSWHIPIGPDEYGHEVSWNLKNAPHALVVGPTGTGKTVLLRSIIVDASILGFTIFGIDPKRIELTSLRGWPGVRAVASAIEEMIALLTMLADEMDTRYAAIEAGEVTEDDLDPVLVVIDEIGEFIQRANAHWKAIGGRGTEHPVVERWRSMSRLGRAGRIHLVVATQRPDAKVLGGEARDNYGFRVALGSLSQDGARMVFGRADVGRDIPEDAKGRATVGVGPDGATEVQSYYTPNPRDCTDAERRHLEWLSAAANKQASDALQHINAVSLTTYARSLDDPATPLRVPRQTRRVQRKRPENIPPGIPAWETVNVTGLVDGDQILVDENGTEVEATVVGTVVETDDDTDEFEVAYRRVGDAKVQMLVVDGTTRFQRKVAPRAKPGVR